MQPEVCAESHSVGVQFDGVHVLCHVSYWPFRCGDGNHEVACWVALLEICGVLLRSAGMHTKLESIRDACLLFDVFAMVCALEKLAKLRRR